MGSAFGFPLTSSADRRWRPVAITGSVTILVAAALAPLLGSLVDAALKDASPITAFLQRELTNTVAAALAIAVLVLLTRAQSTRLHSLGTLAMISAAAVFTFAAVRFLAQLSVDVLQLARNPQWIGPEILWAVLLWPILLGVLWLVSQREQIVDAQIVLLDEARRALQDDHEELRSRVFDHLHGTVTSELVVARVRLSDLAAEAEDPQLKQRLSAIAAHIQRIHELEVRRLAHAMVASGLETSLDEALRQLADSCEGLCEVGLTFDPAYAGIERELDADARAGLRLTVYRVVEECVSNALRHAHADHVDIAVTTEADGRGPMIHVMVASDGEVPELVPAPGVGLRVIRARIAAYDGALGTDVIDGRFVVRAALHVPQR